MFPVFDPKNTSRLFRLHCRLLPATNLALGSGYIVLATLSLHAQSVQDLIALARNKNSRLAYGTPGFGNGQHLAGDLFNLSSGAGRAGRFFRESHAQMSIRNTGG